MPKLTVLLCCNEHRHGSFAGQLRAVDIGGDSETLSLQGDFDEGERLRIGDGVVIVNDEVFRASGYSRWAGNWCWDKVEMPAKEAARLANYLRTLPHWHCEVAAVELFEKWDKQEPITAEDLKKTMAHG